MLCAHRCGYKTLQLHPTDRRHLESAWEPGTARGRKRGGGLEYMYVKEDRDREGGENVIVEELNAFYRLLDIS